MHTHHDDDDDDDDDICWNFEELDVASYAPTCFRGIGWDNLLILASAVHEAACERKRLLNWHRGRSPLQLLWTTHVQVSGNNVCLSLKNMVSQSLSQSACHKITQKT